MEAALRIDAYPGFNAWDLNREAISILATPDDVVVALEGDLVCGYVSPRYEDLTVHPEFRRRGHGRRLFAAGLDLAARTGLAEFQLYVPHDGPGRAFAEAMGMAYRSSLWRLDLPPTTAVLRPAFPPDVLVRPIGGWLPLAALVDLVNACFVDHPSPISWTLGQIELAHSQPDFDPSSVLLVSPLGRPDVAVAFARTALGPAEEDDTRPVGEIRLLGVLPEWRGRGLGRELLRWGVARLRTAGAGRIQLSVEAQNERALGLYHRAGFEPAVEWPHWTRPVAASAAASLSDDDR
jgi:mycothiol synthase